MAIVDASFAPATRVGWSAQALPVFSGLRLDYADRSELWVTGNLQVPADGAAPYTPGQWVPVEVIYEGSFGYDRRGRLKSGTVYSYELAIGDEHWCEVSGINVSLADAVQASRSPAAMFAFEQRILAYSDEITGSDYGDRINAWGGNDSIFGGDGDDIIYGGSGDDVLDSGSGMDVVRGDAGRDRFVLGYGDGHVTIYGYEKGLDSLDLSRVSNVTTRESGGNLWFYSGPDALAVVMGATSL